MIEVLKIMIIGISIASIFSAISNAFVKSGGVSEILKIISGIITIILFLYPLINYRLYYNEDMPVFAPSDYYNNQNISISAEELLINNISAEISSYIENEAQNFGIDCTVTISTSNEEDEIIIKTLTIYTASSDIELVKTFVKDIALEFNINEKDILIFEEF